SPWHVMSSPASHALRTPGCARQNVVARASIRGCVQAFISAHDFACITQFASGASARALTTYQSTHARGERKALESCSSAQLATSAHWLAIGASAALVASLGTSMTERGALAHAAIARTVPAASARRIATRISDRDRSLQILQARHEL